MENRLGFANYTGNLVTSRLGDLCERIMRKNSENQSDLPLTISSIDGLVDQRDYFNKVVAAKDMSGYYLLKRGEFAYNKSYSVGYDYGTIKRLNKYDEGCLLTLYICFAIKSNAIDSNYLECFFDSLVWYKDMANVCTEGARNHGLLNVDIEEFFNIKVVYPADIEEQKKTAKILNNLDEKIKAEKTNVEKLKALKSSMLTKMFPKEGESVPELRFKGFTDPWEQRKVTELGMIYIGLVTTMTKHYTDDGVLLIRNSDIKDGRFEFGDNPIYLEKSFAKENETRMHRLGDVITVHTGDVGTSAVITKNEENSIGFATIVTRPNREIIYPYFLCAFLNTEKHKKWAVAISTGDGRTNYNLGDYFGLVVPVPSIKEQKEIAIFFERINNLITLHQRKYEKLLDVKKAFLEKMIGGDN